MTVPELLPTFFTEATYPIWSPYESFEAANTLLAALAADNRNDQHSEAIPVPPALRARHCVDWGLGSDPAGYNFPMPAYNTLAIVLRRLHYGETDNILTLYSRDLGRFSAIAKGARKAISRLSGATEVLTCTRFGLASGKSLEVVTQCEVQDSFSGLRHDLNRLAHALYLADLIDHAVEDHAPNPDLFDLLLISLRAIQALPFPELAARWFELQLLGDLGYAPNLLECSLCHAPLPGEFAPDERFGLSAQMGGALCPRHARPASNDDHSGLTYDALVLLQILDALHQNAEEVLTRLPLPDVKALDQARLALRRSIRFRLERDLKSLAFLDSLRAVS